MTVGLSGSQCVCSVARNKVCGGAGGVSPEGMHYRMVRRPETANLPSNVHMAGEFFAAAELSKRGFQVSLTMGNAKAVDLFAERDGRSICIQVKAAGGSHGWPLSADKTKIVDNVLFVFVALNAVGEQPDYYVLTPQEVRERARWASIRAGIYIPQIQDRKDAWRLIDDALRESDRLAPTRRRRRVAQSR